ncbi:Trk system potassium uptake protein TrkA [bacterium HR23]|nr:Trk system potassium uptake protein TrkA [bacterium HR23]
MKVLIMGCSRVGVLVATALWKEGHQVRVLDTSPERFLALPAEMREDKSIPFLGDGTQEGDLVSAGIKDADAFVAVSEDDNRNALASQKAKYRFMVPQVICLVHDPARIEVYRAHGIQAISPTRVAAGLVVESLSTGKPTSRRTGG